MKDDDRPFTPDWFSPTGDTIRECMKLRGVSREELSCHLGKADNEFVDALLDGASSVSRRTAVVLADVLGSTAEFWLKRDATYWADRKRLWGHQ